MKQINSLLRPLGLAIARNQTVQKAAKLPFITDCYARTLADFEELFRKTLFPQLPTCAGRHALMMELRGNPVAEALYILGAMHEALAVQGAVCEFGVAEGTTSALLANELRETDRHLWLYDSFEGLPKPTQKDKMLDDIFQLGDINDYTGLMAHPETAVRGRVAEVGFPVERTHVVKGFIEKHTDPNKLPERVCFAYIDFDFYEPTLTALELLHPRLSPGARVIIDDYGYFSEGAKIAADEFTAQKGGQYQLELPHSFTKGFAIIKKGPGASA